MRTGFLLLLACWAISLSTPACGGKLTNAETRWEFGDAASTSTGATPGGGAGVSDDIDGAGGSGATGPGGAGGTDNPDPTGGTTGSTGSGGNTTGGSGAGGMGTGATGTGGGPGNPGGSGGGGGGTGVDAGAGCPENQPSNNSTCAQMGLVCSYNATNCACVMSGGGGGRGRDGGTASWACAGTTDAGRGGRGAF